MGKVKESIMIDAYHSLVDLVLTQHRELIKHKWNKVSDCLPEIPKGKYGIKVLITTWDEVGGYQDVVACNYAVVTNRDGKHINPLFEDRPVGSADFMQLYVGKGKTGWMPIMDEITHWQYYPEAPKLEKK